MLKNIFNSVLILVVLAVGINLAGSVVSVLLPWKVVTILGVVGVALFLIKVIRTGATAKY